MRPRQTAHIALVVSFLTAPSPGLAEAVRFQGNPTGSFPAVINVPVDGTWFVLDELMFEGSFYSPIFQYTFTGPGSVIIDVTDLFVVSDQNEVYLDGGLLGSTPPMPDWDDLGLPGPFVDPPYTNDPDIAWSRPEFSKRSFMLPSGTHLLTLRNIHIPPDQNGNPFPDGTVAFRLIPEPATAFLLLAGALLLRGRRDKAGTRPALRRGPRPPVGVTALVAALVLLPGLARAGTECAQGVEADVEDEQLKIVGTSGDDSLRVSIDSSNPALVHIYIPATNTTPSCSFDSNNTPFDTISVTANAGDDLIVFDDSNGALSASWTVEIDGGDGSDILLGGIDLSVVDLNDVQNMINTLQQARDLVNRVLDLLKDSPSPACSTLPCLVTNTASVLEAFGSDVVRPTAHFIRDIESDLVLPSAQTVRDAHARLSAYLQTFVAQEAEGLWRDAQVLEQNVEELAVDFELLEPVARGLLTRAEWLHAYASQMGLETQGRDAVQIFIQTMESYGLTIEHLSNLCPEDPEPPETDPNEDAQDPNGLTGFCAELERRIEALESQAVEVVEVGVDRVEAEGDTLETDAELLATDAETLGDDEDPNSRVSQIEAEADLLVVKADSVSADADALNADYEQWITGIEADLGGRGDAMRTRGEAEVLGPARVGRTRAQNDVEAPADAIRAEAEQILAKLEALMAVASAILGDAPLGEGSASHCQINPANTITGSSGSDVLIGTTDSDEIDGGEGNDLIIGALGDDRLLGGDDNDLIFGGGGSDEIRGGAQLDILVGNGGDDCLFGGGGETLVVGNLSVNMGDLFFGVGGSDELISGESESDTREEIDVAWGGNGDDRMRLSHGGTLTVGSFSFQLGNLAFGQNDDDNILTADGIDVIFGGADNDTIQTGKGYHLDLNTFSLALGDLIFGDEGGGNDGADTIRSDDPNADRAHDDIDVIFGGGGGDTIHGYGGGLLSIGDPNNQPFELRLGNVVFGDDGGDTITTLDGIDVIFGGGGGDTIQTGKGYYLDLNTFSLALGDLIFGDEGAGNDGADTIRSDDPNADRDDDDIDVIFGGGGGDTIHGYGGGLLSIGDPNNQPFELRLGNVVFGDDGGDTITTLDGIDVIFGGGGGDTIQTGEGDELEIDDDFSINLGDLIFGEGGEDTLHGDVPDPRQGNDQDQDGIDVIFGGTGGDKIYGGTGGSIEVPDQDFCLVFGNLLFGGDGGDTLRGDYQSWDPNDPNDDPQAGIDLIFGADGEDIIEGSAGSLIVIGTLPNNAVIIWFGNLLFGGPGDDVIRGADAAMVCTGINEDFDKLLEQLGITDLGGAADIILAGAGNDQVEAYDGIDFVFGSAGDDNMLSADDGGILIVPATPIPIPIPFGNLMFGGDGEDTIHSRGRLLPLVEIDLLFGGPCDDVISAGDGFNLVFGNRGDDTITTGNGVNVNLAFGNSGNDTITTGDGRNVAIGNRGNDTITTGDGLNVAIGNRGNDTITTGDGLNVAIGNRGDDTITTGGNGLNIAIGNRGHDTITTGDGLNIALGNRGYDSISAGHGLAFLAGGWDSDKLAGGSSVLCLALGNRDYDIITAGSGLNALLGNLEDDRLESGTGLSLLLGSRDNDIVQAGGGGLFLAFGNTGDDVLVGGNGLNILGCGADHDQVFGGNGTNIVLGSVGNDTIRGGSAKDILWGGRDNDSITGGGERDFIWGNRGNDCLASDGGKDFLFGNRGNDHVRSGSDTDNDLLFGNRGDDNLYGGDGSSNCGKDKLFGGRGDDTKHRPDCSGCTLTAPARGEVRGRIMIDLDGDTIGDVPHANVVVTAGSLSTTTDDEGFFRIANLAPNNYTVSQTVPSGYTQVYPTGNYFITINAMGIDLHENLDFVNRPRCFVSQDAWGCFGTGCEEPNLQCHPVAVQKVLRCPETGRICDDEYECPCGDCVESWAVVECACVDVARDCYIVLDRDGPRCGGSCFGRVCELTFDGEVYRCECECPLETASFTFRGRVSNVYGEPPYDVKRGDLMEYTYWFVRNAPDTDPRKNTGTYENLVCYELRVNGRIVAAGTPDPIMGNAIIVRDNSGGHNGQLDQYEVRLGTSRDPHIEIYLTLEDDASNDAITSDELLLCGDLKLGLFGGGMRNYMLHQRPGSWQVYVEGKLEHVCDNCRECPPFPKLRPVGLDAVGGGKKKAD